MAKTVPSTRSCCDESKGSISWTEKVPPESRITSMLATWPEETQADNVVVGLGQRVPEGSGSKCVGETAEAVRVPRVGGVRVTALPFRQTTAAESWMIAR